MRTVSSRASSEKEAVAAAGRCNGPASGRLGPPSPVWKAEVYLCRRLFTPSADRHDKGGAGPEYPPATGADWSPT